MPNLPRLHRLPVVLLRRPRLSGSAVLGLALFALLRVPLGPARGMLLAFDLAATTYLAAIAWMMAHTAPRALARRAEAQHEGRWSVLVGSTVVCAAVLVALRTELHAARSSPGGDLLLAGATIVLSWMFFSLVFAQAYAHADHIERAAGRPALVFPQEPPPDYWDYLYFAVVLSMTFQTSDVDIAGRRMRHMVLLHSVAAFFFNVFIIAITVNIVAGMGG